MHNDGYYTTKWLYKVINLLKEIGHVDILQNLIYVPSAVLSQIYKPHAKENVVNNWRTLDQT